MEEEMFPFESEVLSCSAVLFPDLGSHNKHRQAHEAFLPGAADRHPARLAANGGPAHGCAAVKPGNRGAAAPWALLCVLPGGGGKEELWWYSLTSPARDTVPSARKGQALFPS